MVCSLQVNKELLEACKKLLEACELADLYGDLSDHVPGEIMEIARIAIAKAEGTT